MERTYCGILRDENIGQTVRVCGWVQRARNLGGLLFVDVRDRTGIVQCVFGTENAELFDRAETLRSEFTCSITGEVRLRSSINDKIPTGRIEIEAKELTIYAPSETTPFEILDDVKVNDTLRLKYRYLDLRRPALQRTIRIRHEAARCARDYFYENGFYEIETPILTKSTPEGARDYLVPSRVHPGEFYALPQSPQQYKQLLMLSGFDRYFQIARCFRDEDLRADRQPEFTQIDLEMSFIDQNDIMAVNEGFLKYLMKRILNIDIPTPFLRLTYKEAMERFGSDKPDMRFGCEMKTVSDICKDTGFAVFDNLPANGIVTGMNVPGGAGMSRKEIDALGELAKTYRAKGIAWYKEAPDGTTTSSFAKFLKPGVLEELKKAIGFNTGDLMIFVADGDRETAQTALGQVRLSVAKTLGLIPENVFKFLWVTEFPMFEWGEDDYGNTRLYAKHHPFTAPMDEDLGLFETDPINMRAKAYDVVLNGTELGGGSIRIHQPDVQKAMFKALGFTDEQAQAQFGHLITAFKYGAPPHGGLAYGLDRIVMWLSGTENIRDVIAFPKVQNASELMTGCPSPVDPMQLKILSIKTDVKDGNDPD